MFPIRDHNPSGKTPFVTIALIAINVLVFLGYFTSQSEAELNRFFLTWGLVPARVMAGGCPRPVLQKVPRGPFVGGA